MSVVGFIALVRRIAVGVGHGLVEADFGFRRDDRGLSSEGLVPPTSRQSLEGKGFGGGAGVVGLQAEGRRDAVGGDGGGEWVNRDHAGRATEHRIATLGDRRSESDVLQELPDLFWAVGEPVGAHSVDERRRGPGHRCVPS